MQSGLKRRRKKANNSFSLKLIWTSQIMLLVTRTKSSTTKKRAENIGIQCQVCLQLYIGQFATVSQNGFLNCSLETVWSCNLFFMEFNIVFFFILLLVKNSPPQLIIFLKFLGTHKYNLIKNYYFTTVIMMGNVRWIKITKYCAFLCFCKGKNATISTLNIKCFDKKVRSFFIIADIFRKKENFLFWIIAHKL